MIASAAMPLAIATVLSLACIIVARAADAIDRSGRVPGHPDVTYFDLVKQIVTDLDNLPGSGAPTAHAIVPYRHIEGDAAKTVPAGPVAIQLLTAAAIHADGKPRLALMIDLGPSDEAVTEFTLLALFDMTKQPQLLDVVEVGTDRLTGFVGEPLPLGAGADLIVIDSDHFNSSEDFVGTELLFVRHDRFQLIGSAFTFNARTCTSRRAQSPSITTRADAGRRYREIRIAVRETLTLEAGSADCGEKRVPRPFTRTFRETYRWNPHRADFEIVASDLKKLDRENQKPMSGD
jgi:hypothetical protein